MLHTFYFEIFLALFLLIFSSIRLFIFLLKNLCFPLMNIVCKRLNKKNKLINLKTNWNYYIYERGCLLKTSLFTLSFFFIEFQNKVYFPSYTAIVFQELFLKN